MKTLTIIDENKIMMDNKLFIHLEDEEPTFSVGQWVIGVNYTPYSPARIISVSGNEVRYLYWSDVSEGEVESFQDIHVLRPATLAEIESHLRKLAEEKGYKEGVRIRNMVNAEIHTLERIHKYSISTDSLHTQTPQEEWVRREHSNPKIYCQGKWAEIIPDKKPLPKTREEFAELLRKFQDDAMLPFPTMDVDDFLNQYES